MSPIKPTEVPTNLFERSQWIMTQLRLRGTNLSRLAVENDLHRQVVSLALTSPHARAEELIADALGTKPRVLFPERFNASGVRLYGRRDRRISAAENVTRVAAQR